MRLTYLMLPATLLSTILFCAQQEAPKGKEEPQATQVTEVVEETAQDIFVGIEPKIGVEEKNRAAVGKILNSTLADEYVIYVKTLNYHWNVLGMNFADLHAFFGKQYTEIACFVDMVAERIRALGLRPYSTMQEFLANSHLKEQPGIVPTAKEMLQNLLDDHETLIRQMRADIDACAQLQDAGTNNFLSELIVKHEKMAWMLRSYLSEK